MFSGHLQALAGHVSTDTLASEELVFPDFDAEFTADRSAVFNTKQTNSSYFYQFLKDENPVKLRMLISGFNAYAPLFSSALAQANLPDELKYLAPAVSAMNPKAVDDKKRAGVWQLSHFQAVLNGLQVDRLIDQRFDVVESTRAFVAQMQQNTSLFGSCEKAVLAYFVGNVALRNLLSEQDSTVSCEDLLKQLPDVAAKIAAFQALTVFLKANAEVSANLPVNDTVFVRKQVHFKQVAQVLHIPLSKIEALNPQYPYSIVPGGQQAGQLFLPDGMRDDFLLWQDSIYNTGDSSLFALITPKIEYPPAPNRQYVGEKVKDLEIEGKTKLKYVIQSGDVLGLIAEDYDVRVADLKYWNNIFNERKIRAGATLDIFVDDDKADYYRSLQKQVVAGGAGKTAGTPQKVFEIPENARKVEHVVKNGESPYVIAQKYAGVSPEAILFWNGITDARKIQIGQKLILYLAQ